MSIEKELAEKVAELKTTVAAPTKIRVAAIVLVAVIVVALAWYGWQRHAETEAKLQQAVTITQEQAKNVNFLENKLKESKQNAEMLAAAVERAQAGQKQPIYNFTVQAPTVEVAAQDIAGRINAKDQTLPPAALAKTDRTFTVPQQVKQPDGTTEWQVGIYKVNNYRNWEWSTGVGWHDGDIYVPIGVQRNYSKDAAISGEIHATATGVNGGELKYIRKTDKLFFMF